MTGDRSPTPKEVRTIVKPNKQASLDRKKAQNAEQLKRLAKGQDSRKVHDTKGKNSHGRTHQ